jgi:RNA polymerase sigma-70 factor (ECF subfamily)
MTSLEGVTTITSPASTLATDPSDAPSPQATAARDARLRAMVGAHFDSVWRALKRLGVPDAGVDDAAQQVFLVASRRLDEILAEGERAYLMGVALRVAADARRAQRRRREVPIDDQGEIPTPGLPGPEERLDEQRARRMLTKFLAGMPDEMREAFVLFELEEMSAPDVAAALGVPVGTVASRVRRARDHIRQRMVRAGGEP